MKKRSPGERKEKRKTNLTKYGQDAEQDGDEGVDAHPHLPGAGSALRGDPSGIAPTRLQGKRNLYFWFGPSEVSRVCVGLQPLSLTP